MNYRRTHSVIDVRSIEIPEYEFVEEETDNDADDEEETEGQEEG